MSAFVFGELNSPDPPPMSTMNTAICQYGVATPIVASRSSRPLTTDAQYFLATSDADLKKVYENLTTELVLRTQKTEVTALFTLVAAVFSIVASALSLLWFNRLP
jgi:hypothetical protein